MTLPDPPSDLPQLPPPFIALPITYPPTPAFPQPVTQVIYLRPHAPSVPTPSSSRSLFITNLPPDADLPHLTALLGEGIEKLEDAGIPRGKVVVFAGEEECRAAWKAAKKARGKGKVWGEGVSGAKKIGLEGYKHRFLNSHPDKALLSAAINTDLAAFDQAEAAAAEALRARANMVDDDGFTMVVRGARPREATEAELLEAERAKKKRKSENTTAFYRFQIRESRKEAAKKLVERFEEDKRRLEERKAKRRLRPL